MPPVSEPEVYRFLMKLDREELDREEDGKLEAGSWKTEVRRWTLAFGDFVPSPLAGEGQGERAKTSWELEARSWKGCGNPVHG